MPAAARTPPLLLLWILLSLVVVAPVACAGAPDADAVRAASHIEALAGTIGRRPHGSPAAARARDYVSGELRALGFDVRVQDVEAVHPERGLTARVRNVIARHDGSRPEGIALVAHYDSRPESPGAADDALGVATVIEAARQLIDGGPLAHALYVLITDAEEVGLMGARGLVTDPEIAGRVRAFLNFDGTGGAGAPFLIQATGGDLARAWAAGAAVPDGGSFSGEIYRRLPNDTDFTVLSASGVPGLNVAAIGDSFAYHSDRDVPERVRTSTLTRSIANTVAIVRRLDGTELVATEDAWTFFDLGGVAAVAYGPVWSAIVMIGVAVLAAVAWVVLVLGGRREVGLRRLAASAAGLVIVGAAGAGGVAAAGWVVAAGRVEATPWYAAPWAFFAFMLATGSLAWWGATWLVRRLPEPWQPWRDPRAVWLTVIPVWTALAALLQARAPGAAYLVALPLGLAAIAALAGRRSALTLRAASTVVCLVVVVLWLGDVVRLLGFLVPLSGWLPAGVPWWAYAGLIVVAAVLMAPSAAAVAIGWRATPFQAARVLMVLVTAALLTGALAVVLPAYTDSRPERRAALYVQDAVTDDAWWDVGGNEEMVAGEAWPGGPWTRSQDGPEARAGVAGLSSRSRLMATAVQRVETPALVRARLEAQADGSQELVIAIVPSTLLAARVQLPVGVAPDTSSIAGRTVAGRWTASYAAVPNAGLSIRLGFRTITREALLSATVALTTASVPGGAGPRGLPDWLPTARSTWSLRSVFIVPVRP